MRKLFCCILLLASCFGASAQAAEDSVKQVVDQLFSAMKAADATAIQTVFADSALLQTVARTKEGGFVVRNEPIRDFAASIGKLPKGAADERIRYETIKIDGPLAVVWTPYQFYYNGQFSHCGVNSFQLVRIGNSWKIQYIIDTRRKDDCK
ncbi:MAG: DUF4440 domain-containing protein [Williamsia sp.]|nr:DUF4440 domain-containing protein [Williamsia sp.]